MVKGLISIEWEKWRFPAKNLARVIRIALTLVGLLLIVEICLRHNHSAPTYWQWWGLGTALTMTIIAELVAWFLICLWVWFLCGIIVVLFWIENFLTYLHRKKE
jgi:hypothetical protein